MANYDPELRKTEHGSKLYQTWKSMRKADHCEEWESFPVFYEWAMESGYEIGAWLKRNDMSAPFSPQNCFWYTPRESVGDISQEYKDRYNATVNRIRKHFGWPPLEGTEYGD